VTLPTVTGLCLTIPSRRNFFAEAIRCFAAQTYPKKKLLVVGEVEVDEALVSSARAAGLHVAVVLVAERTKIGSKRNVGCQLADSELIAHFDDDDVSAPDRIEDQVARLLSTRRPVTGYRQIKFTDGEKWYRYEATPDYVLGTSLVYERDWWVTHNFPDLQISEDGPFISDVYSAGKLASSDGTADRLPGFHRGDKIYARIHPGNTSKKVTESHGWEYLGESRT